MKLVVKYDGVALSSAEDIKSIASYARGLSGSNSVAVVCSAVHGTTDDLMEIAESIRREDKAKAGRIRDRITSRHQRIAGKIASKASVRKRLSSNLEQTFRELAALIDGMVLLGEVTPRTMDYLLSFGERLSMYLIAAAISDLGRRAVPLTGKDAGIVTDSNFGQAKPLMDTTRLRVAKTLEALFARRIVPVLGGFVGADQHGHITTLGRGGSDYSATIIGVCVDADEIWLMGKVDGLMTAEPKIVSDARVLREVSYSEAIEMALFGVKQIHPRTFEPLLSREIPMRIRSSVNTGDEGTLITASGSRMSSTAKCVSSIRDGGLVDIQGGSMVGTPGTASKIFATLAKVGINVMMISQNPSESSITVVVKNTDMDKTVSALEMGLLGSIIKRLDVTADMAIIALIGSGMRGTPGVASRAFSAMEKKGLNIAMITQGASELNLAIVVKNSDMDEAVRALHDAFELGKTVHS